MDPDGLRYAVLFTAVVQPWGVDGALQVGGLAFNDCTPVRAIRTRWGARAGIARLRTWPLDLSIPTAMDLALGELVRTPSS